MSTRRACLLLALIAAVLPCKLSFAAGLSCHGVGEDQHFVLQTMPLTGDFQKFVLASTTGVRYEYLLEGTRKIPVGDQRALIGTLLSTPALDEQNELLLETDSYFEMYHSQVPASPSSPANAIFVFNHQNSATEILDLNTGNRVRNKHREQGRISLHCDQFPEYRQNTDAVSAWTRIIETRTRGLAERFATAYIDHNLVFENRFLGVETWQNPFDMWVFQRMITKLKPDVIIETGTAHGGSALFFATILEKVNPFGRIITVEIDPDVNSNIRRAQSFAVFSDKVRLVKGDSVAAETLARIRELIAKVRADKRSRTSSATQQGLTIMVTLDSLHNAEHVLQELHLYSGFVSDGSYIIVQDTIIDRNPKFFDWFVQPWANGATAGPARAVAEFLDRNRNFQRDRRWEGSYFTFYPGGFLRKGN